MTHPFKLMEYKGEQIEIDEDIVPLLEKMWALGIDTINSCQANCGFLCDHTDCNNNVWIAFKSCKDIERLYNIVAEYHWAPGGTRYYENIYEKMGAGWFLPTGRDMLESVIKAPKPSELWAFKFLMIDKFTENTKAIQPFELGKVDFVVRPQVTFPRKHLDYVNNRLELAIIKRNL